MSKMLLLTAVWVPVFLGMRVGRRRSLGRGLLLLLAMLLAFDVSYIILLYYLRLRWL